MIPELSRSLTRRLQSRTESDSTYIPRPTQATLDDLMATAQTLGRVELGGSFHPQGAEIKLPPSSVNDDFIYIRSRNLPTMKENLAVCIHRAQQVIQFYKSI
jgi:hypothetical protein